jgi:hypothetical protein
MARSNDMRLRLVVSSYAHVDFDPGKGRYFIFAEYGCVKFMIVHVQAHCNSCWQLEGPSVSCTLPTLTRYCTKSSKIQRPFGPRRKRLFSMGYGASPVFEHRHGASPFVFGVIFFIAKFIICGQTSSLHHAFLQVPASELTSPVSPIRY